MKRTLIAVALLLTAVSVKAAGLELSSVTPAGLKEISVPVPPPAPARADLSVYRSARTFPSRAEAVNAMMNSEAALLKTGVAVFEKRVVRSGAEHAFILTYFSRAALRRYVSKEAYASRARALNAGMNAEGSMLRSGVPVAETLTLRGLEGSYTYVLLFLSELPGPAVFIPADAYSSKVGAVNAIYNAESRLLAGGVGVMEKRITYGPAGYSFELVYVPAPR